MNSTEHASNAAALAEDLKEMIAYKKMSFEARLELAIKFKQLVYLDMIDDTLRSINSAIEGL